MLEVEWSPGSNTMDSWNGAPTGNLGTETERGDISLEESGEPGATSTTPPQDTSGVRVSGSSPNSAAVTQIPDSPTLSSYRLHHPFRRNPDLPSLLIRTAPPPRPRTWILSALIAVPIVRSMSCESPAATNGGAPWRF